MRTNLNAEQVWKLTVDLRFLFTEQELLALSCDESRPSGRTICKRPIVDDVSEGLKAILGFCILFYSKDLNTDIGAPLNEIMLMLKQSVPGYVAN
jgi:hypothetical protein